MHMAEKIRLTSEEYRKQIEAYAAVFPCYETYAKVLGRILEEAHKISFPEATVQSRAKTISSFAEKAARKRDKYPDAINQMDDLCGARVILQTTEQVRAVRAFIEASFEIVEADDKGLLLREQEFGYRDMHYIVRIPMDRDRFLGITEKERAQILNRRAEIQLRTWLQHAWADTLHDRIYKNPLRISSEVKRTGNLIAALMEEGDRNFNLIADELDGLIANYTADALKQEIINEIEIQELVLNNETNPQKKPGLSMKLARLVAACDDYPRVVELLVQHEGIADANRCELLLDLGYALCHVNRHSPASAGYKRGLRHLEEALTLCERKDVPYIPNLRKRESLHARALFRFGWALEPISSETKRARQCSQQAHEHEPGNPYYLAGMIGLEMSYGNRTALPANMRTAIREGAKTCGNHAIAGIELPHAYFTGGRLNLLLGETYKALGCYARGIRHCLAGVHCIPANILAGEMDWLINAHRGDEIPKPFRYAIELFSIARNIEDDNAQADAGSPLKQPVLIIAGGAASMETDALEKIRPIISAGLEGFFGTVIAGGTTTGVPGCVGDVAGEFENQNKKHFKLIGYLPERIAHGVSVHKGYDERVAIGGDFLPDQILRNWRDILASGIKPQDVLLLGFGGGPLSAVEYSIALGLGASVGLIEGLKGSSEELLKDPLWTRSPNLHSIPFDSMTVRAFIIPSDHPFEEKTREEMAKSFHAQYVANSASRLPANMKPWDKLEETFRMANREQAKYSVDILQACGFKVKKAEGTPAIFEGFTDGEVERMAEMEHGRWNVERLRDGWRYGKDRDDAKKIHNYLVSWSQLPEEIKMYDREAVRAFPCILAQAGLEIFRA
jgi:ppGpp synthetase/RelA/SpoT-type nucleotidyltranferase